MGRSPRNRSTFPERALETLFYASQVVPISVGATSDFRWRPTAAFELAQGDYTDFTHHYLVTGRERGYRPLPPR